MPTWYVARMARQFVPMVLSGDGADELFAGYWSYESWMNREKTGSEPQGLTDWLEQVVYLPNGIRTGLWRPECAATAQPRRKPWSENGHAPAETILCTKPSTWTCAVTCRTHPDQSRIASMAHGLEVRIPFVDLSVADVARRIPAEHSMIKGANGTWNRKALLKAVAGRYFPENFLTRPKMGFGMPVSRWFAPGSPGCMKLADRLLGPDSALGDYFVPGMIRHLLAREMWPQLWLLLVLEEWLQQNRQLPNKFERPEPPPSTKASHGHSQVSRTKILLITGARDGEMGREVSTLQDALSNEFDVDVRDSLQPIDDARYDLIHPMDWNLAATQTMSQPRKWMAAVRSLPAGDFQRWPLYAVNFRIASALPTRPADAWLKP